MLENDIKYLDKVMGFGKANLYNNTFCWLYPFTNENLKAYYSRLNIKDKNVLTVTSSGDHALNALLLGAENVESFDINPLAKYYSELKIAAIKSLDYEEFLLFFFRKKKLMVNSKYYFACDFYFNKIRNGLSGDFRKFWDYFFENYTKKDIVKSVLFTPDTLSFVTTLEINSYLKEENYYKLKNILKNKAVLYHDLNITQLSNLDKEYDLVILSNIASYLENIYDKDCLKYFKQIVDKLNKKNETQFVLCYLYSRDLFSLSLYNDIYNEDYVRKYFSEAEYEYYTFNSSIYSEYSLLPHKDQIIVSKEKNLINK